MKLGRINPNFAIVAPASGAALKGFTRLWDEVCNAVEDQTATRIDNAYVAGAPAATGYIFVEDSNGITYKVLVAT